ncbi:hypothetical protein HN419_05795 [Candidatus Woesearchaeota archaeon]|jgi:hypothetical protein|nr:hypothetical protein [Candidatus Woesearchaeota archaeon]MBT7928496.1 hypothetical protein [Candidatus Peregrinibacteria bacterium]MBT3537617.1 hypothetical protein [Candidatus Woesearchaeota archaeon]MBT4698449.1 hypothetical protein [Candidatus Woesearchaeota archaeon]MBT4716642.1 hypothetical protein [Candidatus Woesearchaeota archaeon]
MSDKIVKIKKLRAFKKLPLQPVIAEVADISFKLQDSDPNAASKYNPHKVELEGDSAIACDPLYLNKFGNQKRRGDYRYLFTDGKYVGLAKHYPRRGYRRVA